MTTVKKNREENSLLDKSDKSFDFIRVTLQREEQNNFSKKRLLPVRIEPGTLGLNQLGTVCMTETFRIKKSIGAPTKVKLNIP